MKNLKNIVFLSNKKIALVVLSQFNAKNNILFANELKVNNGNIHGKLSTLLTDAANFLGSNIKAVDVVFEDFDIKVDLVNKVYKNTSSKDEAIKQIYKDAKVNNKYVNNLIVGSCIAENNRTSVIAKTLVSNYSVYEGFKQLVKDCNVAILNCVNIATLLNQNNEELIVSIKNDKATACLYTDDTLSNCIDLNIDFNSIVNKLANKYACSAESILAQANIASVIASNKNENFNLSWNYDLRNKSLTYVNAAEFTKIWQEELVNQIKSNVLLNNWKSVKVLADKAINNFNFTKVDHDIVGLDVLSDDVVLAIANLDKLPSIESQSKYDSKIESEYERAAA